MESGSDPRNRKTPGDEAATAAARANPSAAPRPNQPAAPAARANPSAAPHPNQPAAPAAHANPSAAPHPNQQPAAPAPRANPSAASHPNQPTAAAPRVNPSAAPRPNQPAAPRVKRKWRIGLIAAALLATGFFFEFRSRRSGIAAPLEGYIADAAILHKEFARFYGKALPNPELETQFNNAAAMMRRREYANAAALLEESARQAPLPIVFNDLGVLYAEMNDRGRAVNAFRKGLARDGSYVPVRNNFERYKSLISDTSDPVTREIEPNDTTAFANLIALDKPVEGEIAARIRDEDTYRFNAPPPPRDVLAVELSNRSGTLIPVVRLYDSDDRTIELGKPETAAGSSITRYFSPAPNVTLYIQVAGRHDTAGPYFLTVKRMKAYDAFEPDDSIFTAHPIGIGQQVEANIMDAEDTDYYSFVAPRTGTVTIEIRNRSTTLVPALTTFHPDRRNSGFGPDLRTPGADLHHRMDVQQNQTYYLQVWSQANSSGSYTLVVN